MTAENHPGNTTEDESVKTPAHLPVGQFILSPAVPKDDDFETYADHISELAQKVETVFKGHEPAAIKRVTSAQLLFAELGLISEEHVNDFNIAYVDAENRIEAMERSEKMTIITEEILEHPVLAAIMETEKPTPAQLTELVLMQRASALLILEAQSQQLG